MVALIIILIGSFILALLCAGKIVSNNNEIDKGSWLFGYTIFFTLFFTALGVIVSESCKPIHEPTAIDVYRGLTELQIEKTYKSDSILTKCDSIVVFKNEK